MNTSLTQGKINIVCLNLKLEMDSLGIPCDHFIFVASAEASTWLVPSSQLPPPVEERML